MFIKLESIEPAPKLDSLLGPAQEEERAENTASDVKEVLKEITKEEDTDGGHYNTAKDKDLNNPFISDHPFN